jgi:hypothetical protein
VEIYRKELKCDQTFARYCKKLFVENESKKKLSKAEFIKEETGLRCGGRGKSEISSAL